MPTAKSIEGAAKRDAKNAKDFRSQIPPTSPPGTDVSEQWREYAGKLWFAAQEYEDAGSGRLKAGQKESAEADYEDAAKLFLDASWAYGIAGSESLAGLAQEMGGI